MKKTLLLAGAACFLSLNANAADVDIKPYVGLDYVYTSADMKDSMDKVLEDKYNSFNLNAGAKFNQYVGMEVFYQKSGEEEKSVVDVDGDTLKAKTKFDAYGVDFAGYLPLSEKLEGIASVGLAHYKFKLKAGGDYVGSESESNMAYRLGLGAQYNINEHVGVRVMGRFVQLDDGSDDAIKNLTELTAGVRYTF